MIEYIKIKNEFLSEPEEIKVYGVSDTPANGLWLVKMDNVGEIPAIINTTDYAIADGSYKNTNRLSKRNITMKFRLTESFADKLSQGPKNIEQTRLRLYKLFPYKSQITLIIKTDTSNYEKNIYCYTESVEPDIFSNKETVSVSLICPDPYFFVKKEIAVGKDFEVIYEGNAETGVLYKVDGSLLDDDHDFSLYSHVLGHSHNLGFTMSTLKELINSQTVQNGILTASSELSQKFVKFEINNTITNIISSLGLGPFDWPKMYNGTNMITVLIEGGVISGSTLPAENIIVVNDGTKPSGFDNNKLIISFKERYGGI